MVDEDFPTISAAISTTPANQARCTAGRRSGTTIKDDPLGNTAPYAAHAPRKLEPNTPRTTLTCIDKSPCRTIGLQTRENVQKLRVSLITKCRVSANACHTNLPDIGQIKTTSWVSRPVSPITLSHTVQAQHLSKQHLEANLVASLELPSVESLKRPRLADATKASLIYPKPTFAATTTHEANKGATTITWPEFADTTKAFPTCKKLTQNRPTEEKDWPKEMTNRIIRIG